MNSAKTKNNRFFRDRGLPVLILGVTALLSLLIYLLWARIYQGSGFPLDDAWIHQVYARNLAWYGQWSFKPGTISAGSTSPLWTFVLSIGYLLGEQPAYLWTFFLGFLGLWAAGLLGELAYRRLSGIKAGRIPWFGLFIVLEWHLVWAAGSGMETAWMAAVFLLMAWLIARDSRSLALAGLVCGISVWIRPDGLTMLGPLALAGWFGVTGWRERRKRLGLALLGFILPFGLYLFFNLKVGGTAWPNTFYAKQAEYAALQQQSIFYRLGEMLALPMVGAGILLLPGFIAGVIQSVRSRNWVTIGLALWWLGYSAIYAWRLPVVYQHGRYLIPAMPIYFVLGLAGTRILLVDWLRPGRVTRWVRMFAQMVIPVVLVAFFILGAGSYAQDVAIINTEMVATAKWVNQNVPGDARIAVHDIGAIGYYCDNDLVDLAGLVSPEVIPFIRDQNRLAAYLDEQNVTYLITFPSWYPELVRTARLIYTSQGNYALQSGGENIAVYQWGK